MSPWPALTAGTFWERVLMPMLEVLTFSLYPAPLSFLRDDPVAGAGARRLHPGAARRLRNDWRPRRNQGRDPRGPAARAAVAANGAAADCVCWVETRCRCACIARSERSGSASARTSTRRSDRPGASGRSCCCTRRSSCCRSSTCSLRLAGTHLSRSRSWSLCASSWPCGFVTPCGRSCCIRSLTRCSSPSVSPRGGDAGRDAGWNGRAGGIRSRHAAARTER